MNTKRISNRGLSSGSASGLRLTYVCNAGFLLSLPGDRWTIAIDAFSKDPAGLYTDTPLQWRERLFQMAAAGKLNLLIISHEHADHYCREDVLRAVEEGWRNGHPIGILTTGAVAEDLSGSASRTLQGVLRQNMRVLPDEEGHCMIDLFPAGAPLSERGEGMANAGGMGEKGIPETVRIHLEAVIVRHDGKQYTSVSNMMLLMHIYMGEHSLKLVFPADASPTAQLYKRIAQWSDSVDWLIVPFPCIGKSSARSVLKDHLKVRHIAACHFPAPESDVQGWYARTIEACKKAQDGLPEPVLLREPGSILDI